MESVFRREVDYLMEGIYLLQHLGAERKYRELKEEIDRRLEIRCGRDFVRWS